MVINFNAKVWFYLDGQNQYKGPFSEQEIQSFFQQGLLLSESYIWKKGLDD